MKSRLPILGPVLALGAGTYAWAGDVELNLFAGASLLDISNGGHLVPPPLVTPALDFPGGLPYPLPSFRFGQRSTLGRGFLLGFRAGYALSGRFQVEASFATAPSRTERTAFSLTCERQPCPYAGPPGRSIAALVRAPVEHQVASYQYDAGLLFHLVGERTVRPFLTAGLGGITYDGSERARTNFAFNVGAGIRIGRGKVAGRVDVRDYIVLDQYLTHGTEHDLQATGGVTVRLN